MSFMFHPSAYDDPNAINPVEMPDLVRRDWVRGTLPVARAIAKAIRGGARRVGIDGYPGAQFEVLVRLIAQQELPNLRLIPAEELLLAPEALERLVASHLPEDRALDPVLLYGVRYLGGWEGLHDAAKVEAVRRVLRDAEGPVLVYGCGCLSAEMRDAFDLRIWLDITPKQAVLNFKGGLATNVGVPAPKPYSEVMRRNYYVDFECGLAARWSLLRENALDLYVEATHVDEMSMLPLPALRALFDELIRRPLRCRPVYLEGVWGGSYMQALRKLPPQIKRCAWIFDMIPMEVSLVADMDGLQFETPFFTFVQVQGEKLLGKRAFDEFGGYFPIRFNYDDTLHAGGNMSIQCHPDEDYVVGNHRELGRQDESYYVCVAGQGARTYLGFQAEGSCEEFLQLAERAQHTGELVDYQKYVHSVPSVPGTQVMIPAGTIHASGRNQVVLEIGSLTVGSYTYKLYDYQRLDTNTGKPRPIHLRMGRSVLRPERTKEWVQANLVNHGGTIREGDGYREWVVGEHDLLYFSLRNLYIERQIEDDTRGDFHVLALVDGDRVRVESIDQPALSFEQQYLDILTIPACMGRYRIVNLSKGPVVIHKTLLKEARNNQ